MTRLRKHLHLNLRLPLLLAKSVWACHAQCAVEGQALRAKYWVPCRRFFIILCATVSLLSETVSPLYIMQRDATEWFRTDLKRSSVADALQERDDHRGLGGGLERGGGGRAHHGLVRRPAEHTVAIGRLRTCRVM